METLPPKPSYCETKSSMSEDVLSKQKEIIEGLIPNLLSDKNSEPRVYDENNVRTLFTLLLESRKPSLCKYVVGKFVSYYLNDIFALECGLIATLRDAEYIVSHPFDSSLSLLMDKFNYWFSSTKSRLLFIKHFVEEQEDSDDKEEQEDSDDN